MPLVLGCIVPHGEPVIPALATPRERRLFAVTTRAMQRLAREIRSLRPDALVLATPHNIRLRGHVGVVTTAFASGTLPMYLARPPKARIQAAGDQGFADALLAAARRRGVPAVGTSYAATAGRFSSMPLDWGALVPLWFFLRGHRRPPRVVLVAPARDIPLAQNVRFGAAISDVARRSRKRVVFVASADHAHTHRSSGPYGFNPAAARYDAAMVGAIRDDDLPSVLRLSPKLVDAAKPDSLWQVAMLHGAAARAGLHGELLSYQAPTYYGMICAAYRPRTNRAGLR